MLKDSSDKNYILVETDKEKQKYLRNIFFQCVHQGAP